MKIKIFYTAVLMTCMLNAFAAPPVEEGKMIFTSRCGSCHNINKMIVGPALAGVDQRRSLEWIIKFVQSSQTVIRNGDTAALALFTRFNKIQMPDHPDLTADNIKNVVAYIKDQSSAAPAGEIAPFSRPSHLRPAYVPLSMSNYIFFLGYLALVGVLITVLLFFVKVKEYERNNI